MRKGLVTLIIMVGIMIIGGTLTANVGLSVPTLEQTQDPNASVFTATPEQATQFAIWIIVVVSNAVIVGGLLAAIFWFGNREVKMAKEAPSQSEQLESGR